MESHLSLQALFFGSSCLSVCVGHHHRGKGGEDLAEDSSFWCPLQWKVIGRRAWRGDWRVSLLFGNLVSCDHKVGEDTVIGGAPWS